MSEDKNFSSTYIRDQVLKYDKFIHSTTLMSSDNLRSHPNKRRCEMLYFKT